MTMKVFVGCTKKQLLSHEVLKHSILTTTARDDIEVIPLCQYQKDIPTVRKRGTQARTGFSFQRFLIPALCLYEGRAVYVDSDMLVFTDIAELFELPMGSATVLTAPKDTRNAQFAVMAIDCAASRWQISEITDRLESGQAGYKQVMMLKGLGATVSPCLGRVWNDLDVYHDNTKLLHYTRMEMQPWLKAGHPLTHLWVTALNLAISDGAITKEFVQREVSLGHVRPAVLKMLRTKKVAAV